MYNATMFFLRLHLIVRRIAITSLILIAAVLIQVGPAAAVVCPAVGGDTNCGVLITVTKTGASASPTGQQPPYDGVDDTLVGVANNSGKLVRALGLSSTLPIFAFDGDGIGSFGSPGNTRDITGYGGPNAYFTNINASGTSGVVNFINPISAGSTAYFSLENALGNAISCSQILNGSVPKPSDGTPSINTAFTPNMSLSLATAAADCGFTGFNWQQTTTHITDPFPFVFYNNGSPVQITNADTPYNDPPKGGGYTYAPGDMSYPFYCNSTDYGPGGVCEKTANSLSLTDTPSDPCIPNPDGTESAAFAGNPIYKTLCGGTLHKAGSYSGYTTHLIGLLSNFVTNTDCIALGTCIDLGIGFSYTTNWNGTAGGVIAVMKNGAPADPGSGTGGITITDYEPNTNYQFGFPLTITDVVSANAVPEPSSISITALGLVVLYFRKRRPRDFAI